MIAGGERDANGEGRHTVGRLTLRIRAPAHAHARRKPPPPSPRGRAVGEKRALPLSLFFSPQLMATDGQGKASPCSSGRRDVSSPRHGGPSLRGAAYERLAWTSTVSHICVTGPSASNLIPSHSSGPDSLSAMGLTLMVTGSPRALLLGSSFAWRCMHSADVLESDLFHRP